MDVDLSLLYYTRIKEIFIFDKQKQKKQRKKKKLGKRYSRKEITK
jgi:hypothetical protein